MCPHSTTSHTLNHTYMHPIHNILHTYIQYIPLHCILHACIQNIHIHCIVNTYYTFPYIMLYIHTIVSYILAFHTFLLNVLYINTSHILYCRYLHPIHCIVHTCIHSTYRTNLHPIHRLSTFFSFSLCVPILLSFSFPIFIVKGWCIRLLVGQWCNSQENFADAFTLTLATLSSNNWL